MLGFYCSTWVGLFLLLPSCLLAAGVLPIDGNWSEWSCFTDCSKSCDEGTRVRLRTCTNPAPVYGGADCCGQSQEVQSCNPQPCPEPTATATTATATTTETPTTTSTAAPTTTTTEPTTTTTTAAPTTAMVAPTTTTAAPTTTTAAPTTTTTEPTTTTAAPTTTMAAPTTTTAAPTTVTTTTEATTTTTVTEPPTITTTTTTVRTLPPECNDEIPPLDIQFLLDASLSVRTMNFPKVKQFVKRFAQSFEIGPDDVNIGVVTFNIVPYNQFWLNEYTRKSSLLSAIDRIPEDLFRGTQTAKGLKFVRTKAFSKEHGNRDDAADILIVVTDGRSVNKDKTLKEADILSHTAITTMAVGVGDKLDEDELKRIASDPSNVFHVSNFNDLDKIIESLQRNVCKTPSV